MRRLQFESNDKAGLFVKVSQNSKHIYIATAIFNNFVREYKTNLGQGALGLVKSILRISLLVFTFIVILLLPFYRPILFIQERKIQDIDVDSDALETHVKYLSDEIYPRNTKKNLMQVAQYIERQFDQYSDDVRIQRYVVHNAERNNITADFGPDSEEIIVVGAHYDAYSDTPGADDNASGVAGLMELAKLLSKAKLEGRVQLVAFDTEEPPYFASNNMGSYHHAKSMRDANQNVTLMLSLEMIGYFSDEQWSQEYPSPLFRLAYPSTGNFIAVVDQFNSGAARKVKGLMMQVSNLEVYSINAPPQISGIDFSDHRNYWSNGYDAVMVTNTAFYRNKEYHTKYDTYDRLDYERMAEVIKGVYWAVVNW